MPVDDAGKRKKLVEGYLAHARVLELGGQDDAYLWAVEAMWELVERDPEGAALALPGNVGTRRLTRERRVKRLRGSKPINRVFRSW